MTTLPGDLCLLAKYRPFLFSYATMELYCPGPGKCFVGSTNMEPTVVLGLIENAGGDFSMNLEPEE